MRRLIVLLGLVLFVSGCGSRNSAEPTLSAPATSSGDPSPSSPSGPSATPCVLDGASVDEMMGGSASETAFLKAVRHDERGGCPRVTFEFENNSTVYRVDYDAPPFSDCGSGKVLNTQSWGTDAYIAVRFEPAAGYDTASENGRATYTGPSDIATGGSVLKHLSRTCDFEGVVSWVLGLDAKHGFKVSTYQDPPRIVVDISGA